MSPEQSNTKATESVWYQRAHPDTSRVTTKRNAKVSAIEDGGVGTAYSQHNITFQCIVWVNTGDVVCCEQVVESLKQPHTQALGFVWCQRAHPDTSRVKTKSNAKVSTHLIMPLTTRQMMLLISCEQVVASPEQ